MSASDKAMEAQPSIFKPLLVQDLERFPLYGDCQKCHQVVDLNKGNHACGR